MDTKIIKLSDVRTHNLGSMILDLVKEADLPSLVTRMNYEHVQSKRGGACRCFFWSDKNVFFGFSDRDDRFHAEEDCFRNMNNANFQLSSRSFWLMYVDLEPCHSGRYKGHNCSAYFNTNNGNVNPATQQRFSLRNSQNALFYPYYSNGVVLYAFSQTEQGEKSPSDFMHGKQDSATNFLLHLGENPLEFNRQQHNIGYFILGSQGRYVPGPNE